jgi:hypothetical protein
MGGTLVIRSSPRLIAPDWRGRIKRIPVVIWLILLITFGVVAPRGPASLLGFGAALVFLVIVGFGTFAAKSLNARVVITPDHLESRDALRRSRRCDRSDLAGWVVALAGTGSPRRYLSKVLLVDRDGRTRLSLAWDSYSDSQLDQIRNALQLPDKTHS